MHGAKEKILVVDDDPNILTYLSVLLEDNGYRVITAKDGKEGMQKAEKENPNAIALDLLLPEQSGIKMFRELRKDEQTKDIPVIVVTGISDQYEAFADFKEFLGKVAIRPPEVYLEKPIDEKEFLDKLKEVLS